MPNGLRLATTSETPPRTWRRPGAIQIDAVRKRNTSTDVEKTKSVTARRAVLRKHLHGRGEDLVPRLPVSLWSETPPRTWRRRTPRGQGLSGHRNTSTDVEKTIRFAKSANLLQKHLHGRGEDRRLLNPAGELSETPPRTWRRPLRFAQVLQSIGNTSTDVEKTLGYEKSHVSPRKHLHGRGEDKRICQEECAAEETPPRTWRRRDTRHSAAEVSRNTSTDVEKTITEDIQ